MRWAVLGALSFAAVVEGCAVDSHVRPLPDGEEDAGGADGGMNVRDAGRADGCRPGVETCNDVDDDCDGRADEGFNFATDPDNCGGCGIGCPDDPPNGSYGCTGGACAVDCNFGHQDCDGDPMNGCEPVTTAERCGSCTTMCSGVTPFCDTVGATPTCVSMCGGGTVLCGDTCVDILYSASHCGACGNACPDPPNAHPQCLAGTCGIVCDGPTYANCDGVDANGCESLRTLENCGACDDACAAINATASCATGTCDLGCTTPYGDCDGLGATGCELALDTLASCGFCGVPCAPDHVTGSDCSGGMCDYSDCETGYGDCDTSIPNGCETDVATSEAHCGACRQACGPAFAGSPQVCTDGLCYPMCSGASCLSPCDTCTCMATCTIGCADDCSPTCSGSSARCNVLADRRDSLNGRCNSGAACTFSAQNADDVDIRCENTGTSCTVRCQNADSCDVICTSDASCTLFCNGAMSCQFTDCQGTETDCGGGRFVCNRGC